MQISEKKQKGNKLRGLIISRGFTQRIIADALRVEKRYVSRCMNINPKTGDFDVKDPYIREGIARYIGLPYHMVWGVKPPTEQLKKQHSAFFSKQEKFV